MNSDDLDQALSLLETETVQTSTSLTHGATSKKEYKALLKNSNVTSFSQLEVLRRCPRKFQKMKEQAAFSQSYLEQTQNIDFAYGHAVGAGVQNFLITKSLDKAWLNAMLAWSAEWDATIPKSRKNLWGALLAVEKFVHVYADQLSEWELLILPNGKPAIEVSLSLHCGDFKHYLHLDIAMRHAVTGKISIWDVKTSGFQDAEEALYANSDQALSYAIALEAALGTAVFEYEVYYLVYSSTQRTWTLLPFSKNALDSAEFVKDLVITQDLIRNYDEMRFFPKRGQACYDFFRRCQFYGECNITSDERLPTLAAEDEAEEVDYVVSLESVIDSLRAKREKRNESK